MSLIRTFPIDGNTQKYIDFLEKPPEYGIDFQDRKYWIKEIRVVYEQ